MEPQEGASTDNQSTTNNTNTTTTANQKQTTPETKTNILCQTKSISTIHTATPATTTTVNTKQPVAMLHFKELEAQLKAERAAQQTDAIAAQQSFEKGPKMIPIEMIAPIIQHSNSDEDSLDDAKNYRLPIGIRKMNEKARAEKLARQQELIQLSQERLKNMPAGVKHFNKMDNDKSVSSNGSSKNSSVSKGGGIKGNTAASASKGREAPPPPASVATEYFRKKELERIQNKLNETSITDKDEEPGSSSDALSADHLDG